MTRTASIRILAAVTAAVLAACGSTGTGSTASDVAASPPAGTPIIGQPSTTGPAITTGPSPTSAPQAEPTPLGERCPGVTNLTGVTTASITASDGVVLYAATFGDGPVGLVMANDVPHSICEELPEAALFARHGFRVEVFDYRDRGASGPGGSNPGRLDLDVAAAAEALRAAGSRCVVLAGSYGGAAAAIVAAVSMRPSPVAVLGFDPAAQRGQYIEGPFGPMGAMAAAPRLLEPTMYVTLRQDRFVPLAEVRRLAEATGARDTRLVVVPSGLIGWGLLDVSPDSARVQREVFGFLREHARCG